MNPCHFKFPYVSLLCLVLSCSTNAIQLTTDCRWTRHCDSASSVNQPWNQTKMYVESQGRSVLSCGPLSSLGWPDLLVYINARTKHWIACGCHQQIDQRHETCKSQQSAVLSTYFDNPRHKQYNKIHAFLWHKIVYYGFSKAKCISCWLCQSACSLTWVCCCNTTHEMWVQQSYKWHTPLKLFTLLGGWGLHSLHTHSSAQACGHNFCVCKCQTPTVHVPWWLQLAANDLSDLAT